MSEQIADDLQVRFVEEVGIALADGQTPPMIGRVLGRLFITAPEPQSAESLAEALRASRGAISMSTRTLMNVGLISRRSFPGDRRAYYEVRPELLARSLAARFSSVSKLRAAIESGLRLLADEPPERRETLEYLAEMYRFFETELVRVFHAWDTRSASLSAKATPGDE